MAGDDDVCFSVRYRVLWFSFSVFFKSYPYDIGGFLMRVYCSYCGKKLRRTSKDVEEGGLFFCSPAEWGRFRHEQALKEKKEDGS